MRGENVGVIKNLLKAIAVACGIAVALPVIFFLLYLLLFVALNSNVKYNGDHPALYTVAVNSFLGCAGQGSNGEIATSSEVEILETDAHGRILFYYHEGIIEQGCGYGILQKEQNGYAYFYEDDCVLCADDDWGYGAVTHEEWFTQEEIDAFKQRNDWGKPINEGKCIKKAIITKKEKSKIKPSNSDYALAAKVCFDQSNIVYTTDTGVSYEQFFTSDDYGREIYYLYCHKKLGSGSYAYFDVAVIFNPDGTFSKDTGVVMIEDMGDYRETLKELKRNNGWNTEFHGS